MKTLLALLTTAALSTSALAAAVPSQIDANRDGVVSPQEHRAYAFDRADEDDSRVIEPNEEVRFQRLLDRPQDF